MTPFSACAHQLHSHRINIIKVFFLAHSLAMITLDRREIPLPQSPHYLLQLVKTVYRMLARTRNATRPTHDPTINRSRY